MELVDLSTLSNVSLAEHRWAAALPQNQPLRLHSALLTDSLKKTGSCVVEESLTDHWLSPSAGFMQLFRVSENGIWYENWLDVMRCSFHAFPLHNYRTEKPKWGFIRSTSQSPDVGNQQFETGKYSSSDYEMGEALEQDLERCAASRRQTNLDAGLGHIPACLQICQQHPAPRRMYMPQSRGGVSAASADCSRQSVHSNFENAPWNANNESRRMTLRFRVRRPITLRWSAKSLERFCGSVKVHVRVFARSFKTG